MMGVGVMDLVQMSIEDHQRQEEVNQCKRKEVKCLKEQEQLRVRQMEGQLEAM